MVYQMSFVLSLKGKSAKLNLAPNERLSSCVLDDSKGHLGTQL